VPLGVVSDVFEVMAQVDRRLTRVSTVDLLIRVNTPAENLGRHNRPPVASREAHPKMSNSKIPHRVIKVLGLPVPFPTSA
jgi:hypothetical protein